MYFRSKTGCKRELLKLHLEGCNRFYFSLKVHILEIIVLYKFVIHNIHNVLITSSLNTAALKIRTCSYRISMGYTLGDHRHMKGPSIYLRRWSRKQRVTPQWYLVPVTNSLNGRIIPNLAQYYCYLINNGNQLGVNTRGFHSSGNDAVPFGKYQWFGKHWCLYMHRFSSSDTEIRDNIMSETYDRHSEIHVY
jgi:hypothetical protein